MSIFSISKRPPRGLAYAGVRAEVLFELDEHWIETATLGQCDNNGARMAGVCTPAATIVTRDDIIACARPTHDGIESLDKDVHQNLVYEDPQKIRDTAKVFQDLADSSPTDEMRKSQQAIADDLNSKADDLEAREKTESSTKVSQEIAFGQAWSSFYDKWSKYYEDNVASSGSDPGDITLSQIGTYDSQYRSFVDQYKSLGKTPTYVPPSPSGGDLIDTLLTILKWGVGIIIIGGAILFILK